MKKIDFLPKYLRLLLVKLRELFYTGREEEKKTYSPRSRFAL
jgi:hypothetical protein